MHFNYNKSAFVHQWYPFVEGYSREFINTIITEIGYKPNFALDLFSGSGTTPVELQLMGTKCYSFEVSPFMHLLASVKLEGHYKVNKFRESLQLVENKLNDELLPIREFIQPPKATTFQPNGKLKKWIFNVEVMDGILDIKNAIRCVNDVKYQQLFSIALASILLEVSNAYRNGKCLAYKDNWQTIITTRRNVHEKFLDKLRNVILPDILKLQKIKVNGGNKKYCIYGDVRENINKIPDNTIDLVITSPPYLNSRDYTDIYIAELWMLDLIKDYDELRGLRKRTLRSHVQVKHGEVKTLDIHELKATIDKLNNNKEQEWNSEILGMVKGYFVDMDLLFSDLKKKMVPGKKVFFNVANSAYYGVEIKVDEIVCAIAETKGFTINEIRKARDLRPSSQQKDLISSLRESVIVMTS
ncbi:MAG: site-specific DNA-methyltransferase [Flavobacterium sp.]|nr:MAG: site-specific DNA-methyltransferase [Flavobacterium sp.]